MLLEVGFLAVEGTEGGGIVGGWRRGHAGWVGRVGGCCWWEGVQGVGGGGVGFVLGEEWTLGAGGEAAQEGAEGHFVRLELRVGLWVGRYLRVHLGFV